MHEQIDQLVTTLETSLENGFATSESFQQALADINAMEPITEVDRLHKMVGTLKILDAILSRVESGEFKSSLSEQYARIANVVERQFGSANAPYARSRDIVMEVAIKLSGDHNFDAVVEAAVSELNTLPFPAEDLDELATAIFAVLSMRLATEWLAIYNDLPNKLDSLHLSIKLFQETLDQAGFDKDLAMAIATLIRDNRLSLEGTEHGYINTLMVTVGLALRAEPLALPALAQPILWLAEAVNEAQAKEVAQVKRVSVIADQCEATINQFKLDLMAHGPTLYHFNQAMETLSALTSDTPSDDTSIRDATLWLIDASIPHAPCDWAEMLTILRQTIVAMDEPPKSAIDLATFEVEGCRILERLKAALAELTSPDVAYMQAFSDMQALGFFDPYDCKDNDEFSRAILRFFSKLAAASATFFENGKDFLMADNLEMLLQAMSDMEGAIDNDGAKVELSLRASLNTITQMLNQPINAIGATAYQRQAGELILTIVERMKRLNFPGVLVGRDATEFKRVESRMNKAFNRLRGVTTNAQWIDQQRSSLRSAVRGLRQFERRQHLMVISPPWTAVQSEINANSLFVSGGATVQSIVDSASRILGYEPPIVLGVNDPTQARWDQISRSVIAVFDFTSYNHACADSFGDIPSSPDAMGSIAEATANTALVAYECGWAFVLGVPMVIVARKGQAVPFDIDVEPVWLTSDTTDVERVCIAIQASLFGIQRGVSDEGLSKTIDYLTMLVAQDSEAALLINSVRYSADATSVRHASEGVLERLSGRGLKLALPVFPPAYPPNVGRKALFHVTAFRQWSEACQRVVRDACSDVIEYRIGYEQFDPDIIRSIWKDLATASYVVADLTYLNPNAVLEFAIAQALGRPTLVVSQTPNLHEYFPPLEKVRVYTYTTDAVGLSGLRRAVDRFIAF